MSVTAGATRTTSIATRRWCRLASVALAVLLTMPIPLQSSDSARALGPAAVASKEPSAPDSVFDGPGSRKVEVTVVKPRSEDKPNDVSPDPQVERQTRPWRIFDCRNIGLTISIEELITWCGTSGEFTCEDGSDPRPAVIYRTRPVGTKEWSVWRLAEPLCPSPEDDLATELAREIRTLKIPPRHARIAPVTTWFTVQIPMTYFTDAGAERLEVTVLGTDVELELTPSSYSWDPGDGSAPIVTTKTGAPYPDQTITHTYTKVGSYRVTLTTTWRGRFRVAGETTWRDIEGTGTTTHTSAPFEIREVRSVLTG